MHNLLLRFNRHHFDRLNGAQSLCRKKAPTLQKPIKNVNNGVSIGIATIGGPAVEGEPLSVYV